MKVRRIALAVFLTCCGSPGFGAGSQIEKLTASNLGEFLLHFKRDMKQANLDLGHLSDARLPLLDESGHPLGRRGIKDRRATLTDVSSTLRDFERSPRNLVVTMTLSDQTEELADEVYDLSQIAYDNDREELAMQFTDLLKNLNDDADLLQAYALDLAAQKESELRRLRKMA
jgi:hypothetical protein